MKKTLGDYIFRIRSLGGYTFTLDDVRKNLDTTESSLSMTLNRYCQQGKIAQVRQGFYCIIPPEYSHTGMLPVTFFIDDLMKWLGRPYYLALFTAAVLQGAGHQQPMESWVMIRKPPLRAVHTGVLSLNFLTKGGWDQEDIISLKTDMGYIPVSSPELTALDFLAYSDRSGINRVIPIIEELSESMTSETLRETAERFPIRAPIQRLGYLLDRELDRPELARGIQQALDGQKMVYAPLSVHHSRQGEHVAEWKVIRNLDTEDEP